ncbi:MAG TPA: site-specific integrase, partial [Ilumatobacteraceae bacterium]
RRAAQAALNELLGDPGVGRPSPAARMTVSEMVARAMAVTELSPLTREDWERVIRDYITPQLGGLLIAELTAHRVDRHYAELRGAGVSAWRLVKVHEVLSSVCSRAVRWGWLAASPIVAATRPVRPKRRTRAHPDDVLRRLSVAALSDPVWGLWFHLASVTGARRGELAALTWGDIDFDEAQVSITKSAAGVTGGVVVKSTKTDEHRVVPVDAVTVDMLRGRLLQHREKLLAVGVRFSPRRYVFAHRRDPLGNRPVRPDSATQWFVRLRDDVGAPNVRLGDLRHLTASELLAAGVEVNVVAEMLGHSPQTLLRNYAHVLEGRKRAAAETMGEIVRRRSSSPAT